jgi:hypothetical protein
VTQALGEIGKFLKLKARGLIGQEEIVGDLVSSAWFFTGPVQKCSSDEEQKSLSGHDFYLIKENARLSLSFDLR